MSTDEAPVKVRVSKKAPRSSRGRRTPSKTHQQPVPDQIHAMTVHTPAPPGSEMVMIPVRVLPVGTHKKSADAEELDDDASAMPSFAARRAARKASRLRKRARRYAAKAKASAVSVPATKNTKMTEKPVKPVAKAKPKTRETTKTIAKAAPVRRQRTVALEQSSWLPRPVRTVLKTAFILLILLLSGGAVYTFVTGGSAAPVTITATPASATEPAAITPHQAAPNAPESAAVQMVSSPVRPGDTASISIKTLPGSACTISVIYADQKVSSMAAALPPATADDFGTVNWEWVVDTWAPDGSWPVTVTCAHNKKSAVVQAKLLVSRAAPASAAN